MSVWTINLERQWQYNACNILSTYFSRNQPKNLTHQLKNMERRKREKKKPNYYKRWQNKAGL